MPIAVNNDGQIIRLLDEQIDAARKNLEMLEAARNVLSGVEQNDTPAPVLTKREPLALPTIKKIPRRSTGRIPAAITPKQQIILDILKPAGKQGRLATEINTIMGKTPKDVGVYTHLQALLAKAMIHKNGMLYIANEGN